MRERREGKERGGGEKGTEMGKKEVEKRGEETRLRERAREVGKERYRVTRTK